MLTSVRWNLTEDLICISLVFNDSEHLKNVYELLVFLLLRTLFRSLPFPLLLSFKGWFCSSLKEKSQGSQAVNLDRCLDIKDDEKKKKKRSRVCWVKPEWKSATRQGGGPQRKQEKLQSIEKAFLGSGQHSKEKNRWEEKGKVILFLGLRKAGLPNRLTCQLHSSFIRVIFSRKEKNIVTLQLIKSPISKACLRWTCLIQVIDLPKWIDSYGQKSTPSPRSRLHYLDRR